VSYGCSGGAGADRTPVVFGVGSCECLIDARFDVALWLAAHGCQLRNYKIAGPFKHALFAEREGFNIAQICQVFEHSGNFENVAGAHFV
jgi:hypothetical protein